MFILRARLHTLSLFFFFLMIRRPPRSTLDRSSAASDVYKRQVLGYADLRGVRFDHAVFNTEHLQWMAMKGAKLQGASLRDARFTAARLMEADLRGADLTHAQLVDCLLYTSPSPRDRTRSRMPSSA
mgnify:CR=1 FL=1